MMTDETCSNLPTNRRSEPAYETTSTLLKISLRTCLMRGQALVLQITHYSYLLLKQFQPCPERDILLCLRFGNLLMMLELACITASTLLKKQFSNLLIKEVQLCLNRGILLCSWFAVSNLLIRGSTLPVKRHSTLLMIRCFESANESLLNLHMKLELEPTWRG